MHAAIVFVTLAVASAQAQLLAAPAGIAVAGAQASQYHAQDELGQYSYGYAGGPSSKAETKTADGIVRGAYSYVDGNGLVQSVNYVADPINGFRVAATNLPVGPAAAPAVLAAAPIAAPAIAAPVAAVRALPSPALLAAPAPLVGVGAPTWIAKAAPLNNGAVHIASLPVPPADTPEVQAARAAHLTAKILG